MLHTILFVIYLCGGIIAIADIVAHRELFLKETDTFSNAMEIIITIILVIAWPITTIIFIKNKIFKN